MQQASGATGTTGSGGIRGGHAGRHGMQGMSAALAAPGAAQAAALWDAVRVCGVDVHPAADGGRSVVYACVELGRLLPVDAVVELYCDGPADVVDAAADADAEWPQRMWSDHAHRNGRFVFATRVEHAQLAAAGTLRVRVRPSTDSSPRRTRDMTLSLAEALREA